MCGNIEEGGIDREKKLPRKPKIQLARNNVKQLIHRIINGYAPKKRGPLVLITEKRSKNEFKSGKKMKIVSWIVKAVNIYIWDPGPDTFNFYTIDMGGTTVHGYDHQQSFCTNCRALLLWWAKGKKFLSFRELVLLFSDCQQHSKSKAVGILLYTFSGNKKCLCPHLLIVVPN